MSILTYNETDFPAGRVCLKTFTAQLAGVIPEDKILGVNSSEGIVQIVFENELTTSQISSINGIVNTHTGSHIPNVKVLATSKLVLDSVFIDPIATEWKSVSNVIINPDIFGEDLTKVVASVAGNIKVTYGNVSIRVVEYEGIGDQLFNPRVVSPVKVVTPSPDWQLLDLNTNAVLAKGSHIYRLEVLPQAGLSSCEIKYCSLLLVKVS